VVAGGQWSLGDSGRWGTVNAYPNRDSLNFLSAQILL
jgi:hypothetical protein